jgi:CRP-like cAMP-binding protein
MRLARSEHRRMLADVKAAHIDLLSKNQLLSRLEPHELEELLSLAAIEHFGADDVIFHKGDPGDRLYAILSGRVGINTVSRDGKEIILNILDPGEVFGEIAVLDGKRRTAGALAMEPTKLVRIGRAEFLPFLERHPRLSLRLIEVLCERLRWTSNIIEDTIFLDIPRRLAKRLLTLIKRHGQPVENGVKIDMILSQEDLAHMLGATRESVNKGHRALEERGVISRDGRYIVVHDVASLEKLLDLDEVI